MKKLFAAALLIGALIIFSDWGFFAHKRINHLAVFTLPPAMIGFYKENIRYLTESSVNPDRRRYSTADEAPRHYIDLDHYGDSAIAEMPRYWQEAVDKYSEDTLKAYGIVPWHINRMYFSLRDAFLLRDPARILRLSAEIGHYIADANVPLHTTENYNGQLTGQDGIHAFWESRLPELFSDDFNYFVGKAEYISSPQLAAWSAVIAAHQAVDSVLEKERFLAQKMKDKKFSYETKGKQTVKVYAPAYAKAYSLALNGMVERQMRSAIKMIGDYWFTAWIDGGQPDMKSLIGYKPSERELKERQLEILRWKQHNLKSREHESD